MFLNNFLFNFFMQNFWNWLMKMCAMFVCILLICIFYFNFLAGTVTYWLVSCRMPVIWVWVNFLRDEAILLIWNMLLGGFQVCYCSLLPELKHFSLFYMYFTLFLLYFESCYIASSCSCPCCTILGELDSNC